MARTERKAQGGPSDEALNAMLDQLDPPTPAEPEDPRMGVPEGWPMIHTLMSRILADVGPVVKNQTNTSQNYNFRGVDQVVNAVNAAFKKHRVYPTSSIMEAKFQDTHTTANKPTREVTGRVLFTFFAPDGSTTCSEVLTEALDQSDKGGPKAMSVALRICLLQMLLLPTTDPTTDDDGHYHTRDGVGSMSKSVAAYVMDRLLEADLAEVLGPVRSVISEHAAWDREVPSGNGTWQANFLDRLVWLIQSVASYEEGKAVKKALADANLLSAKTLPGETLAQLLSTRAVELREMFAKTHDHVMAGIMAAQGQDQLDIAIGCGHAAAEAGTILPLALESAIAIAEDRRAKLPEFAPQPDDGGELEDAAAAEEDPASEGTPFDPPYVAGTEPEEDTGHRGGYDREAFKAFCTRVAQVPVMGQGEQPEIRASIVTNALVELLTGGDGEDDPTDTASTYGTDGFVVVQDAILAAHRREGAIGEPERKAVEEILARYVAAA